MMTGGTLPQTLKFRSQSLETIVGNNNAIFGNNRPVPLGRIQKVLSLVLFPITKQLFPALFPKSGLLFPNRQTAKIAADQVWEPLRGSY
jgi:hypothetical protein